MKLTLTNPNALTSTKLLSMLSFLKKAAALAVMLAGVQISHGFALLGPYNEAYQVAAIGYGWDQFTIGLPGGVVGYSGMGGPKQLGQGYRRNTPVLYYAMDANFLNYFGSNGVVEVDKAFALMNSLTNVSMYSPDLSEFPLQSQRFNTEAQALSLTDLRSTTLHLVLQQLGIAPPVQYTWTLKDRTSLASPCPVLVLYFVIQRNFEIMPSNLQTPQYSPYVNGVLYTYGIVENCTGPLLAYTIPYAVDADADTFSPVAEEPLWIGFGAGNGSGLTGVNSGGGGLKLGGYYTYFTRDDIAGLRYLLQTNNFAVESSGADTVQFVTNNTPTLLTNSFDLGLFTSLAPTNSAAQLQALYPGLQVDDTTNWFQLSFVTNTVLVVTNLPFAPAGTIVIAAVPVVTPTVTEYFGHNFGNIITNLNTFSKRSSYRIQTITPGGSPFMPAGATPPPVTNTSPLFTSKTPSGSFFILPTNLCGIKVIQSLYTNVTASTNVTFSLSLTNGTGSNETFTVSTITYFTNDWLVYLPVTCPANTVGLRQGIERVQFVRRDFDSLVGTFWAPQTNIYSLVALTNNTLQSQQIERVVNQPDFLFTARDLAEGPQATPVPLSDTVLRTINYTQSSPTSLAGPGTIHAPSTFTFNEVGTLFYNETATTLSGFFNSDQSSAVEGLLWASFDGTTNEPIVYPNGTSIANLINQLVIQVQPSSLPNGNSGGAYSFVYTNSNSGISYTNTLSVTGGQSPYVWSLSPQSFGGLPPGLSLSASGQLSGTPDAVATPTAYDFTVRVTDAGGRYVDVPYTVTIDY